MLDTVRLRSRSMDEATVHTIERHLERRSALNLETGELRYDFTTGPLAGSWDTRVHVQVEREEWQSTPKQVIRDGGGHRVLSSTSKVPCDPYLIVEGSVHKALQGTNVHGGPERFLLAVQWFVADIADRLGVDLPDGGTWNPLRIDWAECYDLGGFVAVQEFMSGIRQASYPRRTPLVYGNETLLFPSRVAAPKFYHKGIEFAKHDRGRLLKCLDLVEVENIQEQANGILRTETSIKDRAIDAEYGAGKTCAIVQETWLKAVHDREIGRILREGENEVQTVRHHLEVSRRLQDVYNQELANRLYGTWFQLATLPESEVRSTMKRATFFRQRKQLEEAGVSWHATNVKAFEVKSAIPAGFSPIRSDPRRMAGESEQVRTKLDAYSASLRLPA